jgi:hypothetical protein
VGRIAKQVTAGTTRYYWYPGEKRDWIRAGIALVSGLAGFGLLMWLSHSALLSVTAGASITAALAGVNFGKRDYRAAHGFPDLSGKALRRAAVAHGRRAAWRALVEGCGGAAAAALIANLPPGGFLANWVLPIVPATVGALAHQAGMVYERLAEAGTPEDLPRVPAAAQL